jgi:hypothetical protein
MFCGECGRKVTQVASLPELVEPVVAVTPEPEPEPAHALDDEVERTILAPRRRPAWTLTGPDGIPHPIRVPTLIGRAPHRPADRPGLELLSLVDETKSLSKSHAIIAPDGESFTVEDIGSTNGVLLIGADGSETELPSGRAVTIERGSVLEFGDYTATIDRGGLRPAP